MVARPRQERRQAVATPLQNHDRAFRIGLPPWAIYQLQDREEAGEFAPEPVPDPGLRGRAARFFATP